VDWLAGELKREIRAWLIQRFDMPLEEVEAVAEVAARDLAYFISWRSGALLQPRYDPRRAAALVCRFAERWGPRRIVARWMPLWLAKWRLRVAVARPPAERASGGSVAVAVVGAPEQRGGVEAVIPVGEEELRDLILYAAVQLLARGEYAVVEDMAVHIVTEAARGAKNLDEVRSRISQIAALISSSSGPVLAVWPS
jgi:hypothetical protein